MSVVPFKHFPLADSGISWSFSGEDGNRLIDSGGWSLFKQTHTWFDSEEGNLPENKSAYKLPHHKEIDGEVKTVWRGVTAAMSRLMQQNTQIPEDDRRSCYNHLSRHYREFDEEPPEYGRYSDEEITGWLVKWGYSEEETRELLKETRIPSRIFGEPTSSQLEKINILAKRPLSKEEVFVFSAKMAGDAIIRHPWPIKLHKSLLETFKHDALSGVAFLLDHPWAGFGRPKPAYSYGRTYNATLRRGDGEGEDWSLYGDVYIVRGKEKDNISTDAIISDIEDGTLFDVSVGFGNSIDECSICGNDIWNSSKCEHWPGYEYDEQLCYIIAKPPGFLMELSGVFDGAYPSAQILSSINDFNDNTGDVQFLLPSFTKLDGSVAQLCRVYSTTKNRMLTFIKYVQTEKKLFALGGQLLYRKGGEKLDKNEICNMQEIMDVSIKDEIKKEVVNVLTNMPQAELLSTPDFITQKQAIDVLGKEYDAEAILKFAKEGIAYREELIQDVIEWGIRALGNDFPVDSWKQILFEPERTIEAIKEFREGFKKQTESSIPAGRKTESDTRKGVSVAKNNIPDECFRA